MKIDKEKIYIIHTIKENKILSLNYGYNIDAFNNYDHKIIELLKKEISTTLKINDLTYVIECIKHKPIIYIFGGGNVALALSNICKICNFYVVVFDQRKELAHKNRFINADEVICDNFINIFKTYKFKNNAYYVIATNTQQNDQKCLQEIIQKNYEYIGMLGSKQKSSMILSNLEKNNYPKEQLSKIYTPIGFSINAQSPEEIAISILAQIIEIKNSKNIQECYLDFFKYVKPPCILCTIISTTGSCPRKIGCKMIVYEDGSIYNTIGGGNLEVTVINKAKKLFTSNDNYTFLDYVDANQSSTKIQILLEKITFD